MPHTWGHRSRIRKAEKGADSKISGYVCGGGVSIKLIFAVLIFNINCCILGRVLYDLIARTVI